MTVVTWHGLMKKLTSSGRPQTLEPVSTGSGLNDSDKEAPALGALQPEMCDSGPAHRKSLLALPSLFRLTLCTCSILFQILPLCPLS